MAGLTVVTASPVGFPGHRLSLESTGPCGKLRGTALQLHEKYLAAAKDAQIQNDDILAETCFQYADHYMHIQNQAIANEQALHLQQQAARSTAPAAPMQSEQIIDADMPAEETDTTVKVVDLSVPVAAMNAEVSETQNLSEAPAEKPRKVLRPRIIRKPTPDSNQSE